MSMFGAPSSGTGFTFGAAGSGAAPSGGGFSGFSFGTTTSGATSSTTSGGFGGFSFSGAPASSSAGSTGFSFGAATKPVNGTSTGFSGFSLGSQQPTSQASSTSSGFSFGQPATTSEAAASTSTGSIATGAASGFAFKTATSTAAPPPAYSAASGTSGSLLGGLLSAPASTAASTLTTTSSLTPSTAFSFGATGTTPTTTSATTTTSTTGFNFGFGSTPQSSAASTLGGLGGFGATSTSATSATTVTSTLQTSTSLATTISLPPVQKPMTFRQLEDTINKWTAELEEQEKYFLEQATQVNAWDRVVMENGEKIVQLNQDVEKVKLDQQKLDHELDFVQSQQKELEDILVPLEKALDSLPPISYQQHADIEREHTYNLAESLDAQLKRMGQDLKEIIERLNANNSKPEADDPVHQITKILNAHFMSLMWVDRNTANLQKRVEEISKQMDIERREQEKYFRLAYS